MSQSSFQQIRESTRAVLRAATHLRIDRSKLDALALRFEPSELHAPGPDPLVHELVGASAVLAYLITTSAAGFGSGYSNILPASEARGVAGIVQRSLLGRFRGSGALSADDLANLTFQDCADLLRQPLDDASHAELVTLITRAWNDLGRWLNERFEGNFLALAETAQGSATRWIELLAEMPYFRDVQNYRGLKVPFYFRSQRLVRTLHETFGGQGPGQIGELAELAPSADNIIPHVLRLEGVIVCTLGLAEKLDHGELIATHTEREVELRAAALYAVDGIAALQRHQGHRTTPVEVDIWLRKLHATHTHPPYPPHRCRTVFY